MFKTISKIVKYPRLTQDYPEKTIDSRLFIGRPEINTDHCTGCGECAGRCPSNAIVNGSSSENIGINYDECVFCALCEDVCPVGAVKMTNKFELAVKDKNLLRDRWNITSAKTFPGNYTEAPFPRKEPEVIFQPTLRRNTLIIEEGNLPEITEDELNGKLKERIIKVFGRSLQIREVDAGSCNGCDYEINALNNPFNDIERLGIHFVASPRHADMLLVTGIASRNMEQALIKTYTATPDPKLVVAVGACACSGGIFRDNYAANKGIDCLVPVDVYIPGCPPRPQAILYGILKALDRVK